MWCGGSDGCRYLAVNMRVRRPTADSGAVRSARVPKLKRRAIGVAIWHRRGAPGGNPGGPGTMRAPAAHGRLEQSAGLVIAPFAIDETAGERQLIGAAVVLAQHLDRLIRRRFARAIELGQPSFARCH